MSPKEREKYRLEFRDGLVLSNGIPLSTIHFVKGVWIWVMDEKGNFYAHPWSPNSDTYHSSFFAGEPVRAAGLIRVNQGIIEMINNESGHYKPSKLHLDYAVDALSAHQLFAPLASEAYDPDRSRRDLSKEYALP